MPRVRGDISTELATMSTTLETRILIAHKIIALFFQHHSWPVLVTINAAASLKFDKRAGGRVPTSKTQSPSFFGHSPHGKRIWLSSSGNGGYLQRIKRDIFSLQWLPW
jgi:hypothetical protein